MIRQTGRSVVAVVNDVEVGRHELNVVPVSGRVRIAFKGDGEQSSIRFRAFSLKKL